MPKLSSKMKVNAKRCCREKILKVFSRGDASLFIEPTLLVMKSKIRYILRLFCLIFTSIGFIYQSLQILTPYISGKTYAEYEFVMKSVTKLPAITVCLPELISFENVALNYPQWRNHYSIYLKTLNTSLKEDSVNNSAVEYFRSFKQIFFSEQHSVRDFLTRIGTNSLDTGGVDLTVYDDDDQLVKLVVTNQFESLVVTWPPIKCYTILSEMNIEIQSRQFQLIKIQFKIRHHYEWYPINSQNKFVFISFHSSNYIPNFEPGVTFRRIYFGYTLAVTFSEIELNLLPEPYDTNCKNYRIRSPKDVMRSDCMTQCILNEFAHTCSLGCLMADNRHMKVLRKGVSKRYEDQTICNTTLTQSQETIGFWCFFKYKTKIERQCQLVCDRNCVESYYRVHFEKFITKNKNVISISLEHDQFPDQIIRHKPKMNFTTMASNFGGILGLWLGLNVYFILIYLINCI